MIFSNLFGGGAGPHAFCRGGRGFSGFEVSAAWQHNVPPLVLRLKKRFVVRQKRFNYKLEIDAV